MSAKSVLHLLDGEGEYFDRSHACVKLSRGSFVQRLPGVKHSTIVKPDGKWLEFFICVSAESYHNLLTMDLMSDRPVMNWEEDDRIRLACRLIERYSGRITGQEIAAQMNLGYEALRKQFRASTGISIGQYAIGIRVNRAKALLLRSNLPLEKLALQLGYPDCFSFCKQFKQHTGVSPSQFWRMN